jgi:hypothetical protein
MPAAARLDRDWVVQPSAEALLRTLLSEWLSRTPKAARFADDLLAGCGVRLRDLLDHVAAPRESEVFARIEAAGWRLQAEGVHVQPDGYFPEFVVGARHVVWFRVESVEQFLDAHRLSASIEGEAFGPLRRAIVFESDELAFGAIERRGHVGFDAPSTSHEQIRAARLHLQTFRSRRRYFDTVEQGLAHTEALVDAAVAAIGRHWACDLWLTAEREYWMTRCSVGRRQKARQDALGIGWSNIDHHTYDGSRRHFRHTVRILEKLGYELREMLYAGEMAGWGSQILEQPALKSTIFADVDLAPHELEIDFAHEELPELDRHRRAGVLSALHGESILEAGLNHVAALYDQTSLRRQLNEVGVTMMSPFSNFPHLYQELTQGDWAAVEPSRVDALEAGGHIGAEEAERIRLNGAIISHLENIERNDGFKGFNKPGIDGVLRKLDPRQYADDAVGGAKS